MTTFPTMQDRDYHEYACPECGTEMWIHVDDGDETDVQCGACGYRCTAGDVRHRE